MTEPISNSEYINAIEYKPKSIRIGITGTSGIGKTTLLYSIFDELRPLYSDLKLITEVARDVLTFRGIKDVATLMEASQEIKTKIQCDILANQIDKELENYGSIISDRTVFDCIAYSKVYNINKQAIEHMDSFTYAGIWHYNILFYCPIPVEYEYVDDGIRSDKYVYEVDELIEEMFKPLTTKWNDTVIAVKLPKQRSKWLEKAMKVISKFSDKGVYNENT